MKTFLFLVAVMLVCDCTCGLFLPLEIDFGHCCKDKQLKLFEKWEDFQKNGTRIMEEDINIGAGFKEMFKADNENERDFALCSALPNKIKPTAKVLNSDKKRLKKVSMAESRQAFITHVDNYADVREELQNRHNSFNKKGLTCQPFIICVGSYEAFYVVFDDIMYKFDSLPKAVDICFKSFMVLNLAYPKECQQSKGFERNPSATMSWFSRVRRLSRPTHRIIDPTEDCFLVTVEEGELFYKAPSDEGMVCGIYMIAEPDKKIEVVFNYIDVPCDNGGLVAWVDGWELNGQVWPADSWDDDRVVESCDQRPAKKLVSRQNAALVQYRVPAQGKGFAVTIRHVKNARPCNAMLFGSEGVYTVRNHGETGNCSVLAVSPATVHVLDLNVGQSAKGGRSLDIETGTIYHCTKRGLADHVDIGGASGLDHTKMEVLENMCGLDSTEARRPVLIACEDTVVRLVSSGRYHNSVTVAFAPLPLDDLEHADLMCALNDL